MAAVVGIWSLPLGWGSALSVRDLFGVAETRDKNLQDLVVAQLESDIERITFAI